MPVAARYTDLKSLADGLGFAPQHIFYLVKFSDDLYREIQIPKKSGGLRQLKIPSPSLKAVQKAVLRGILESHKVHSNAAAYVPGQSVADAAKRLCGKKNVLRIDLEDFFPSITSKRVFGLFRSMGHSDAAAIILTRLTTHNGALCQGAPSSPYISNLICRRLDDQLSSIARRWNLDYLRYSDDLYFWGVTAFNQNALLTACEKIIQTNGFCLNQRKTKYYRAGKYRVTLGLRTDTSRPSLTRKAKRELRAAFHKASRSIPWGEENADRLQGLAEWYRSVYGRDENYTLYRRTLRNIRELKLHEPYMTGTKK